MGYKHLTTDSRSQIYAFQSTGMQQKDIAENLGVSASTICRELKRNIGQRGYRQKQADEMAVERRHKASCRSKKMINSIIKAVEEKLSEKWSPE